MIQTRLIEEKEEKIEFRKRDFLYNNGLTNAYILLLQYGEEEISENYSVTYVNDVKIILSDNSLAFYCNSEKLFNIYKKLLEDYYRKILYETDNDRAYVSPKLDDVIESKKIAVKPFASRVKIDKLQREYAVKKISYANFRELYEKWRNKKLKENFWYGKKNEDKIKKDKDVGVVIYKKLDEATKELVKNIEVKSSTKKICSVCNSPYTILMKNGKKKNICVESQNLLFDFGYSPPINRDHRLKDRIPLCYMCDMFYRLSVLHNYFYNNTLVMFDIPSLIYLKDVKMGLGITSDFLERGDRTKTNISTRDYLRIDANSNYSSLLNTTYHLYRESKKKDILLDLIKGSQIIKVEFTSNDVKNSIFYNKLSYLFRFFDMLKNKDLDEFFFIGKNTITLADYCYFSKTRKEFPRIYEDFCRHILDGTNIECELFDASYFNYRTSRRYLKQDDLYSFLKNYNKIIGGGSNMEYEKILDMCSGLGKRIGYFAADCNEKNLVYQIREIGNVEKLVEFFRDFEYAVLKHKKGETLNAKDEKTDKKYSEIIEDILKISNEKRNISLIRDLLGIFAVQNYLSTEYAKSKGGEK